MIYIVIAVAIILFFAFCYYQNNKIDISEHTVLSDKINDSVKIVHLSDLHSKPFKKVIDITEELRPDIITITGDYINDRNLRKEKMLDFGKALLNIAPVLYITGNHERRLEDFDTLMKELSDLGFIVLLNDTREMNINGNLISVLGLDENQASFEAYSERKKGIFEYKDMKPYFDELAIHESYKLVLSHFPENFEAVKELDYSRYDFDLQLSGHAHGGQFILPFIGPIYSPGQGLFPKYARGVIGERPKLIISRGLGNSEFPLRLFNHPEINVITLKPQN